MKPAVDEQDVESDGTINVDESESGESAESEAEEEVEAVAEESEAEEEVEAVAEESDAEEEVEAVAEESDAEEEEAAHAEEVCEKLEAVADGARHVAEDDKQEEECVQHSAADGEKDGTEDASESCQKKDAKESLGQEVVDVNAEDIASMKEMLEKNEAFRKAEEKKGVVYIERVPPFMQPEKVRHVFTKFGKIGRVFLTPEDKSDHRRRVKRGGQRKTKYVDGWVEFFDKKKARIAAAQMNCQTMGGTKRHNFWRDDIWTVRYLPKFKWINLMEHRHYVKQVRKAKLEQRMQQARKENAHYVEQVERKKNNEKKRSAMEEKRANRQGGIPKKKKGIG